MGRQQVETWPGFGTTRDFDYAVTIIETVAWLAGRPDYLDDLRQTVTDLGLFEQSGRVQSTRLFEWFATMASYQGISDLAARTYLAEHERPRWRSIAHGVRTATCPLLESYWHFAGCGYRKGVHACSRPDELPNCPLPRHEFRNGNLNQLAYSLFLFIRDVADGDLLGWLNTRLAGVNEVSAGDDDRVAAMARAIIEPLSGVHGLSNKVLGMIMSDLLLIGADRNPLWAELGGSLIAVDTLVHNFLSRTGILRRAQAEHPYGPRCYGPTGCAAILRGVSRAIDARQFNPAFPAVFPRYLQWALWAYCAEEEQAVCNGRTIKDDSRCSNRDCRIYGWCDRVRLRQPLRKH